MGIFFRLLMNHLRYLGLHLVGEHCLQGLPVFASCVLDPMVRVVEHDRCWPALVERLAQGR